MKRKYILLISLLIFVIVLACSKLGDVDTWFHLKTGQLIYENHSIPRQDPFSYTADGKTWITHEWLFQILIFIVYKIGGIETLILLKIAVIIGLFAVIWGICETQRLNSIVSTILLVLLAMLMQGRFSERPQIFSYLFFAIVLKALLDYRSQGKNRLYILPIIMLLWANIHSAFIFGLTLIGLFVIIQSIMQKKVDRTLWLYAIISSVVVLINPNGFHAILYPFKLAGNEVFKTVISELQSPYHRVNQSATFVLILNFFIGLWVASLVMQILKKKLDYTFGIISLLFLVLTLMASRNRALFGISSIPFLINGFKGIPLWQTVEKRKNISRLYWGLGLFLALLLVLVSIDFILHGYPMGNHTKQKFGLGIEKWVPQGAADFIEEKEIKGKMFNDFGFGGYLLWRLYPQKKVFIDGRNLVYGEEIYQQYWQIQRKYGNYEKLIQYYGINFFVVRTLSENDNKNNYIHSYLSENREWVPIYWDDVSLIYIRDNGLNSTIAGQYGFRYLDPLTENYINPRALTLAESDSTIVENIEYEVQKMLKNSEESTFTNIIAARVYGNIGKFDQALEIYERLSELNPNNPGIFRNLGILHSHYKYYGEAEEAFQKAIQLDRKNENLYFMLANVYLEEKKFESAIKNYKKAIDLGLENGEILLNISLCYEGLNQKEKAEEYLQRIKEDYPNSKAAVAAENYQDLEKWKKHLERGEIFKQQGQIYNAIEEYQLALNIKPEDATTLTNLSNLYLRAGNQFKALETCLQAIQVDSTFPGAYNNLGVIYINMGNQFKAREAWEKAVEIDPNTPAKKNLERLEER